MYPYRTPYPAVGYRFPGLGWPLVGAFLGGLLGGGIGALANRPWGGYGYPGYGGYPGMGYPGVGYPGVPPYYY